MTSKIRIPKRVGGVKLPRKIRRKAKKALKMADNPAVRQFAAAAMGAAARAGAKREGDGDVQSHPLGLSTRTAERPHGSKLGEAFRAAAIDGLRRFLEGLEEGLREAAAKDGNEAPPKRPRPRSPPADAPAA